jgi:nucleoside-triphosphatase
MNIVLTGIPGIGKTTLIRRIANALGDRCGGFTTREIRKDGVRTGFGIESLDGRRGILASKGAPEGPRVGPYTVDVESLEAVGVGAVGRALEAGKVVVIDEIGKMELMSERLKGIIIAAFESELPVIATMGVSRNAFMEGIRKRKDTEVLSVTAANRNDLESRVLALIESGLSGGNPEAEDAMV